MGASVIPFCCTTGGVHFLFHKTFSGRRTGCLVDFGGGSEPGEGHRQTAMREFIEETEAMFLADDPARVVRNSAEMNRQLAQLEVIFEDTLAAHPDWWCSRADRASGGPRDWKTFFVEFDYRDVAAMNRAWEMDNGRRFTKRRELVWVPAETLRSYYLNSPKRLWKRLRQLVGVSGVIRSIEDCMQTRGAAC